MKQVDSDALGFVNKALGITGPGASATEFADGILDQVFDVTPAIRRGRTLAAGQGIFYGVLQNVHAIAESLETSVAPFNIQVGAIAPYPGDMSDLFDLWLLGASVRQISGTGTFTGSLMITYDPAVQGFGVDDSGVAVVLTRQLPLAFWDSVVSEGTTTFAIDEQGNPYAKIGIRLHRATDTLVTFRSTSSALATFACFLSLGLFPAGLGQDASV